MKGAPNHLVADTFPDPIGHFNPSPDPIYFWATLVIKDLEESVAMQAGCRYEEKKSKTAVKMHHANNNQKTHSKNAN